MKILHIIDSLYSGGAEKLIEQSLPLLNDYENVKAEVLLLTDKINVFEEHLKNSGVKVDVVPLKKLRNPLNIIYIREYIIKGNYDLIHVHLFHSNYWTSLASKIIFGNKPKFVLTEHNTHNRRREKPYFKYIEKFIYSSYDKVISISNKTQENLLSWLEVKDCGSNKFVIVENGIELNRFIKAEPYSKSEINSNFSDSTILLCMVGRFSNQKDQSTIIKAMKKLPSETHLLLLGEGDLKRDCEILAEKIGVNERVHFLGFRNDIDRIFKTSDIVVLSSHWEGFGLVAAEGMASGKPVIASDVDGLREVVQDHGILFKKGDSIELSQIIKRLISDKNEYNLFSKKCKERADSFDIKTMVNRYIKEYQQLI